MSIQYSKRFFAGKGTDSAGGLIRKNCGFSFIYVGFGRRMPLVDVVMAVWNSFLKSIFVHCMNDSIGGTHKRTIKCVTLQRCLQGGVLVCKRIHFKSNVACVKIYILSTERSYIYPTVISYEYIARTYVPYCLTCMLQ